MVVSVGLTFLGISLIALICLHVVAPIPHTAEFVSQFTVLEGFLYADQPAKTAAYQACCLASPLLLILSFWFALRSGKNLKDETIDHINTIGIILYLALMVACAIPIVYCPNPPFWILPPSWLILPFAFDHPFYSPGRMLLLLLAIVVAFHFIKATPSRKNADRVFYILLAIWAVLIPSRFYPPVEINDEPRYIYHLNSVLDALSQSVNGHHLLVDYPHIYGGYIEMLAPIIRLFPRSVGTLILSLGIPNIIGTLCMLLTARLLIRRPAILFLCGLSLLSVATLGSSDDLTYGYTSARLFLVPVALLAAATYFRRPAIWSYALTTILAALSSIWNLDTGIVFCLSWLATLLALAIVAHKWRDAFRHILIQGLAITATWTGFLLFLRAASGVWPDVSLLFYFQTLVVNGGYFCLRMIFPDMWVFIASLYIIGLVATLTGFARNKGGSTVPTVLLLSMLGIGIFSYFMGRSAPSNLVAVAYPAVILAGVFCAQGDIMMQRRILPANARFFLLPARIALFWWAFLMVAALPELVAHSTRVASVWNDPGVTSFRQNVAFIRQRVQPQEDGVFYLSNHSGFYYYLTDTTRSFKIPGMVELLRTSDMKTLVDAIRSRKIKKLFLEENFYTIQMYRSDVYAEVLTALKENYRESATSPTATLKYYLPR
jgi:hypothetical protein